LTAITFFALFLQLGPVAVTVAYCAFAAALIAALFIDLELFIIPDEVNVFALLVGVVYDVWAATVRLPGHNLIGGWLPHSIRNGAVCAAVFVAIQLLGSALFRKDAMGDGDVKLARAIGAMLPLWVALVSFLFAICAGAVLGVGMILVRYVREGPASPPSHALDDGAETGADATPLTAIVGFGVLYVTYLDLVLALGAKAGIPVLRRIVERASEPVEGEDDFVPGPTHIPFGPYMVVGAVVSIFIGQSFIDWYLAWAHLTPSG
jgi:leader peptidase (prepilin peptidase) / N-methyltransferase